MTVRTRFAPSPTGYLHIGGVRTALFNWLLAKAAGGQFILRIDDTDADRNVEAALQPILDGFRWLGMQWDEGPDVDGPHAPYFQSKRADRHREAVDALLACGAAYRDYTTPEEMQEWRKEAESRKERFFYDRRRMAETDEQAAAYEAEGRPKTVRLKMPREGDCVVDDLIRGNVSFAWSGEQDHVIQRADGSCIYHLASAIDDHDFEITHVVRAEEHFSNTPRQVFIMQSLGYSIPKFAHLPYVAEPNGTAKLSKRKLAKYEKVKEFADLLARGRQIAEKRFGNLEESSLTPETFNPVIIDFYREIGFLPEAILNYLVMLGWSLDGETEKFTVDEMIKHFSLERVNKAPASFDPQKLVATQGDYFAELPTEEKLQRVKPFIDAAGWGEQSTTVQTVVELAEERLKMAGDIYDFGYFFEDGFPVDEKAKQKHLVKPEGVSARLLRLAEQFDSQDWSDADGAKTIVNAFCESEQIKLKQIIHALRVATTGQSAGIGMFETLAILGKSKVVERLNAAAQPA